MTVNSHHNDLCAGVMPFSVLYLCDLLVQKLRLGVHFANCKLGGCDACALPASIRHCAYLVDWSLTVDSTEDLL